MLPKMDEKWFLVMRKQCAAKRVAMKFSASFFLHNAKGKKIGQGWRFYGEVFFCRKITFFRSPKKSFFKGENVPFAQPWDASNSCETFHRCLQWKLSPKLTIPRSEADSPWPLKDDWRWNIRSGGWGLAIANGFLPFAFAGGGELDDRTIWSQSVNREILA